MKTCHDNWPEVAEASRAALTPEITEAIERAAALPHSESHLITILHLVQARFGHLGREQLDAVAQLLQVPAATVAGVASFYHFFRLNPAGRHRLSVCMGTACYVKGAEAVAARIREELGIGFGETSRDGLFSLDASRCVGTCGLAPILMVDEEVHGHVTPDDVPVILKRYIQGAKKAVQQKPDDSGSRSAVQ